MQMITSDCTKQTGLEKLLQPLVDLLNRKFRGNWEEQFCFCTEAGFTPLNDTDCALIELPEFPDEYPEISQALQELVVASEACAVPYPGRPNGSGPVCGPCRFSVQHTAFSDDGCAYLSGSHLVGRARTDRNESSQAKRQIAYLYRGLRDATRTSPCFDPSELQARSPRRAFCPGRFFLAVSFLPATSECGPEHTPENGVGHPRCHS